MPFQSEKQRRYLHANHPEIAKRWERDYANGGISNLFKPRTGFHQGSLRHQKEHDYQAYEKEGNFMKYLMLSGDRAKSGPSPEGGVGGYSWLSADTDERMGYDQWRDDFETMMKERFMYGEHKRPNVFKQILSDMKNLYKHGNIEGHKKAKEDKKAKGGIAGQLHLSRPGYAQGTKRPGEGQYNPVGKGDWLLNMPKIDPDLRKLLEEFKKRKGLAHVLGV